MVLVCFIFLKGWKFYKKRFLETWRLLSALIHKKTEDGWRGVRLTGWLRTEQEGGIWKRIPSNSLKGIEFVEEKVAHNEIISCANNFYEKTFWMRIRTPIDFEMMTTLAGKQTPNFFSTHPRKPQMLYIFFPLPISHFLFCSESGTKPLMCLIASVYLWEAVSENRLQDCYCSPSRSKALRFPDCWYLYSSPPLFITLLRSWDVLINTCCYTRLLLSKFYASVDR